MDRVILSIYILTPYPQVGREGDPNVTILAYLFSVLKFHYALTIVSEIGVHANFGLLTLPSDRE